METIFQQIKAAQKRIDDAKLEIARLQERCTHPEEAHEKYASPDDMDEGFEFCHECHLCGKTWTEASI